MYDLYQKIKPVLKAEEDLWCYALPLVSKEKKLRIDSKVNKENLREYSFKLDENDRDKMKEEILGFHWQSRTNTSLVN